MFGKELAHDETYFKEYGEYKVSSSFTVYECAIELSRDKDGNTLTNKDGTPRYHMIDEKDVMTLKEDKLVKEIREGFYKDVYQVNGDYVEKVEREDKRIYYVVPNEKVKTLKKDARVIARNGTYREVKEVGYVLVDDFDIEKPKIITVRKFQTEDHQKEAEDIIKARTRKFRGEEEE